MTIFLEKNPQNLDFMRKTAFLESIYILDSPCVHLKYVLHILDPNQSHYLSFPRYFAQFFVKKQILPSTIPMEHFKGETYSYFLAKSVGILRYSPSFPKKRPVFVQNCLSLFGQAQKIHESHRSSISSYSLWHRIVLFVPRSRINAHTFHFFRRTPAGYCPAPANAATFPCHTPPRSPL